MARIILQNENLNLNSDKKPTTSNGFISDRDLLKQRSKKYLDAIASLDHGTLTATRGMEELMKAIQEEFGTAELASLPLGIVSKCFLGESYEVHTLDLTGGTILQHFKTNEVMNPQFEKARALAKHNAYIMVEVYTDKILLIREDGSVSKL